MISKIVLDVDGVLTDGSFWYARDGKYFKRFGSHDAHAIKICLNFFEIVLITADEKGYEISNLRATDMGLQCHLVKEIDRANWLFENCQRESTAFVADSFTDIPSLDFVMRTFAPANAHPALKARVDSVLLLRGGDGAVSEALDMLLWENHGLHLWEYEFTN